MATTERNRLRLRRKKHVRKQLRHSERPLLTVYRSSKHTYAQLVDPFTGKTLTSASTRSPDVRQGLDSTKTKAAASKLGEAIARRALEREIAEVSFNRNGFVYSGRIKALADAAREAGLRF
jgi:large subunit ribosomal protein L18